MTQNDTHNLCYDVKCKEANKKESRRGSFVLTKGSVNVDYNSKRWRNKAKRILRRDGYMCQYSKRFGKRVDAEMVHHIYPVDTYPQYQWCDWNLISLSNAAHDKMHDRKTRALTAAGLELMRKTIPPSK